MIITCPSTELIQTLRTTLYQDIAALMPEPLSGASEILAHRRLQEVAEHSPILLVWFAQPWWSEAIASTLIHCARIHLYARILDDALDENLPIHRLLILRAQSLFWASVGELAKQHHCHWQESTRLIHETIKAVEKNDAQSLPDTWGLKNHHLLLIPLFLSGDQANWQQSKTALSDLIWLLQTGDEWQQGLLNSNNIKHNVLKEVERIMTAQTPAILLQGGWNRAAERALWECEQLLTVLSNH